MLEFMLSKKPGWIHLRNEQGWLPLHSAASLGCHQVVSDLVEKCPTCTMERDIQGFLPIQLACSKGHVKIVQKLLELCLDPTEMVNDHGHNLLHVACECGNYELVIYVLKDPNLSLMINQKDFEGNTPLHLATSFGHAKIVSALTWDSRVNLSLLNKKNLTF